MLNISATYIKHKKNTLNLKKLIEHEYTKKNIENIFIQN